MCFTTSDLSDDLPPRPAQNTSTLKHQQQPSRASMPQNFTPPPHAPRVQQNAQPVLRLSDEMYAPPPGPPPQRRSGEEYAPPPGPPPSHHYGAPPPRQSDEMYAPPPGPPPRRSGEDYMPPSGPPPSHHYGAPPGPPTPRRSGEDYAPPSGPPSSHTYAPPLPKTNPFSEDYQPPSGPPPSHNKQTSSDYAPPPGAPPSQYYAPPPGPPPAKHDWESAVPDTSLLPPPPSFFSGFDRSPANNATEEDAEAGERWCAEFPLTAPLHLSPPDLHAANTGDITMFAPPFFKGTLTRSNRGIWRAQTSSKTTDTHLVTYPPLYSAAAHNPLLTGRRKLIYYEVRILPEGSRSEVSLALGFAAPPYPPFRLPGWHRASLGVHGDDGHRYVNDRWGGKPFTRPFNRGEVLGLGMEFVPSGNGMIRVEVFFTRDGVEVGRWDLREETDRETDLPITGLEGGNDVCAAVGVFEKVGFEVVFAPGMWVWKGWSAE